MASYGVQACRLPALKPLQPLKTLKTLNTFPTGTPRPHINGFLWASKPAVCQPQNPLKTLKTLNTFPTGIPRPHQWLLMGVQACRCQKRFKSFKPLQLCKSVSECPTAQAKATPSLLLGGPACRLPALKPPKTLKTLKNVSNRHPKATHQWLLMASKPAVCQPLNP